MQSKEINSQCNSESAFNGLLYDGYSYQDLEDLIEWPCQDLHGGKMPFADQNFCKHEVCHPRNEYCDCDTTVVKGE
jgi:hypothetical protein